MTPVLEFLLDGIGELIFAIGGVRLVLFLLFTVVTIFFITIGDYIPASVTGVISLTIASTLRKRVRANSEE